MHHECYYDYIHFSIFSVIYLVQFQYWIICMIIIEKLYMFIYMMEIHVAYT